jgi:hypothetical protein
MIKKPTAQFHEETEDIAEGAAAIQRELEEMIDHNDPRFSPERRKKIREALDELLELNQIRLMPDVDNMSIPLKARELILEVYTVQIAEKFYENICELPPGDIQGVVLGQYNLVYRLNAEAMRLAIFRNYVPGPRTMQ